MLTIMFTSRKPVPDSVQLGMESDRNAESLRFLLPQLKDGQIATLQMLLPDGAPEVMVLQNGLAVIPDSVTQVPGKCRAWVEIMDPDGEMIWNSEQLTLEVGDLPPISEETERRFPTLFQEAIAAGTGAQRYQEAARQAADVSLAMNGVTHIGIEAANERLVIQQARVGDANAYAIAQMNGFDGTEEEWEAYIQDIQDHSSSEGAEETAAEAVETAEGAVTTANQARTTANQAMAAALAAGHVETEEVILTTDLWEGTEAPFTATVACEVATADNLLIVGAGGPMTKEENEAFQLANLVCTGQDDGEITFTAFGMLPMIALKINVAGVNWE